MRLSAALGAALALLALAPSAQAGGGLDDFGCRPSRAHPHPVVLVPATFTTAEAGWGHLGRRLARAGYCAFGLNYGAGGTAPMQRSAAELARFVARVRSATGAARVQIVGHSQGGLMPRWYLRFRGGARHVEDLIGIAPPNHGMPLPDGVDPSTCQACAQMTTGSRFLAALNRGRDVERGVDYTVVMSRQDDAVVPLRSALLAGPRARVTNVVLQRACPLNEATHTSIASDPVAIQWVLNALSREGPANRRLEPDCD